LSEGDSRRELSMNIKRPMDLGRYRGMRSSSLPVRGQRTCTNVRTRKGPRKAAINRSRNNLGTDYGWQQSSAAAARVRKESRATLPRASPTHASFNNTTTPITDRQGNVGTRRRYFIICAIDPCSQRRLLPKLARSLRNRA
jgi:hypothetical protein